MDDNGRNSRSSAGSGANLRRPMQIVKKRSGPLEDALAELCQNEHVALAVPLKPAVPASLVVSTKPPPSSSTSETTTSPPSIRRKPTAKEKKEKKRERWLLTRKTWKYMTDAGRKLIPEGVQNRAEDIPKIERHFHQICANEPRFVLWRRKSSYPGATRNSKRRLKQLLQHTGGSKLASLDALEQEEANNADQVIDLLQSYLKLNEARKTTTLLGSKTVRPDQTASPSAQRPVTGSGNQAATTSCAASHGGALSSRGPGFLPPQPPRGLQMLSEVDQLLERLRNLSRSATCRSVALPLERITPALLEDKALLKQIYNELKKQQLHRVLGRHSTPLRPSLPHSSSLSSLWHFGGSASAKSLDVQQMPPQQQATSPSARSSKGGTSPSSAITSKGLRHVETSKGSKASASSSLQRQRKPPSTLDLTVHGGAARRIPSISVKKPSTERTFNTCGTQTSFIQLHEIKRLAEEYKEQRRGEAALAASTAAAALGTGTVVTDDETDGAATQQHHRRKSSIDNEDVSQSVSDTIKRYLRMARKKSVHDENANRFKRVNYDRNLRNIRAKGEINPPGMDEGNSKAVQTLDAWPVITLNFIRGHDSTELLAEAHAEWRKSLDERIQKKLEFEEKMRGQEAANSNSSSTAMMTTSTASRAPPPKKHSHSSCSSSSAPTSPTSDQGAGAGDSAPQQSHGSGWGGGGASGLLHSSTQFLSNLWHGASGGGHHQQQDTSASNSSISSTVTNAFGLSYNPKLEKVGQVMQKSKSSSNVGQFVSKKILKSRSKSQTRPSSPTLPKWMPAEKFTWTSDNGGRILLSDMPLQDLSEIEAKILQRVAIEKINELNIGVNVTVPGESDGKNKRRPLSKKKAMTTSFFDIGKKDDKNSQFCVFGNSLENCVANDKKCLSNLTATSERGSRNSIASLFRSSSSKVRSCESLPSSTFSLPNHAPDVGEGGGGGTPTNNCSAYYSNLSETLPMSRSQSDMRRSSQEYDSDLQTSHSPPSLGLGLEDLQQQRQVPAFISACIRHLEEHGMHLVGLFRVSTSKKRVRQMREEFDRNASTSIEPGTCPHDVATLLKEFLRDLPEPLLCRSLYKAFLETQRIRNRRLQLEALSHLVKLLPTAHRDTLYALLRFLARVAACSDDVANSDGSVNVSGNKMDSNNLATVFAPNILRASVCGTDAICTGQDGASEQESMADAINVIRTMIDHYEELFRVPAELVDAIYTHMFDTCPQQLNYLCEQRSVFDTDEMDTGSSNTPLSSPPPPKVSDEAVTHRCRLHQMFGHDFPSASSEHTSESGSTATTPTVPPRRIYTRESVMHENSATSASGSRGNSLGNVNSVSSSCSRSRRFRPKYSDSDSSIHRRLFGSCNSLSDPITGDGAAVSVSHTQQMRGPHLEEQRTRDTTGSGRRQSSPYVLDKTGIVTASLQIPVQMPSQLPQGAAAVSAYDDLDDVFYTHSAADHLDLSNIPYIEEASGGLELESFNEGFPITGSLSFGSSTPSGYSRANTTRTMTTSAVTATSKSGAGESMPKLKTFPGTEVDAATAQTQPQKQKKLLTSIRMKATSTPLISSPKGASAPGEGASGKAGLKNSNSCSGSKLPAEPKLPTSISNIGGAILRSKTADFERMSLTRTGSNNNTNNSNNSNITSPTASAAANSTSPADDRRTSQTPLYKRQAIISSAKRSTMHK